MHPVPLRDGAAGESTLQRPRKRSLAYSATCTGRSAAAADAGLSDAGLSDADADRAAADAARRGRIMVIAAAMASTTTSIVIATSIADTNVPRDGRPPSEP